MSILQKAISPTTHEVFTNDWHYTDRGLTQIKRQTYDKQYYFQHMNLQSSL